MQKRLGKFLNLISINFVAKELGKQQDDFKKELCPWLQNKDVEKAQEEYLKFREKYTNPNQYSEEKIKKVKDYLEFYWDKKEKIVKGYTMKNFTAGACSTQRAESLNANVKRFLNIARRNSFLKLIDCFEIIQNKATIQNLKTSRISKMKTAQTEDPLFLTLN